MLMLHATGCCSNKQSTCRDAAGAIAMYSVIGHYEHSAVAAGTVPTLRVL